MKLTWANRFAFFDLNRIMQGLLLPPRLVYGGFVPNLSFAVMTVRLNKRRAGQMPFLFTSKIPRSLLRGSEVCVLCCVWFFFWHITGLYIFINLPYGFRQHILQVLNLLLHVSTYISHYSGVPMNPDYLQSAFAHLGSQTAYSFRIHTV